MKLACAGRLAIGSTSLALVACTSVTGVGGSSSYACQAPEGVTCNSVSGVYANAVRNNLPLQRQRPTVAKAEPPATRQIASAALASRPGEVPVELRSRPRLLRLWFKPWEDADGDLFDQGYVYVQIDAGQWRIDHLQRRIRESFAPVKPPTRGAASTPEGRNGQRLPGEALEPRQVPRSAAAPTTAD